ncbi:MAG: hypothetical protein ABL962_09600 [Fimbriimonadaceae bacterium]
MAREWKRRLGDASSRVLAGNLYQGRAFLEAKEAARLAQSPLQIISAGLGLISAVDEIPSYSLTISEGHADSISRRVREAEDFKTCQWWTALRSAGVRRRSLADEVASSRNGLFVLALSPVYLGLVMKDLLDLSSNNLERLRIIGPRKETDLPEELRHVYVPYDSRLDGKKSPHRGTESDFPQRAGRHFVELLLRNPRTTTLKGQLKAFENELRDWPHKEVISRMRMPEGELRKIVKRVWRDVDGRPAAGLRRLRDEFEIACEQKRFYRMFEEISAAKR